MTNDLGTGSRWQLRLLMLGALATVAPLVRAAPIAEPAPIAKAYSAENRSIVSSGVLRSFVLARPDVLPAGLPLVFSLHGDGGNGAGMRASLPLEAQAQDRAVFVYPSAPGGTFEYFSDIGRTREVQFVRDVVAALQIEFAIDPTKVFITGFSGGATMANALGCRLGADEVRALGIHSGSLYPVGNDFTYTGNGGVSCPLPATILVWGENDNTPGVDFATGQGVRNNHRATQNCASTSTPRNPAPCISYDGCTLPVAWCAVPGLGHSVWNQAAVAIWAFFADTLPASGVNHLVIYDEALRNGFLDYSYTGGFDFADMGEARSGTNAIEFTAHGFAGLSFARPAQPIAVAAYPELRFWIRGTAGNEQFVLSLQTDATEHANVTLDNFIVGGAVVAGAYREVRVRFADPPLSYAGSFNRINVQDASGNTLANAQVVFVDDVMLIPAGAPGDVGIHADGFEL